MRRAPDLLDAAPDGGSPPATVGALYRRVVRRHRGRLAAGTGLVVAWQCAETLVPILIGVVIDRAVATGDRSSLLGWCAALVALFAVLSYGYRFGSRAGVGVEQREAHLLRGEVVARVLDPRGTTAARLPGETLSVATSDAEQAALVLRLAPFFVSSVVSLAVAACYLLLADLWTGVVVLVGVPVVLGAVRLLAPAMSRHAQEQQDRIARASGVAADLVAGLRVLKGVGGERAASAYYAEVSVPAADAGIRAARSGGLLTGVTTLLSGVLLAVVALIAGQRALDGDLSVGQFVAIVGLSQFLAEPLRMLGELAAFSARSVASGRRVLDVLLEPVANDGGERRDVPTGALEVSGAFRAEPGRLVAVVVDEAAAADGLLEVLGGAVAKPGRARLGDADLADVDLGALRERLLVLRHHVDVFEGTLRSNLAMGGVDLDDEQWDAVLRASALDDVVGLDDAGLERPVAAGGTSLSGGQRQRLALARALAARPPVLVLDDPTTAVDAVTEDDIARALRAARPADAVTVVLTTSPALLSAADEVVHVAADGAVAVGAHRDLLDRPAYRDRVLR